MSRSDPLGLFPEKPASNQPAPRPAASSSSGGMGWMIVGLLLGVALLLGFQRFGEGFSFGGGGDQQEDTGPLVDPTGYLIFVHERFPLSPDHANMLDVAAEVCAAHPGLEWRSVDDDLTDPAVTKIVEFAKSKGVSPPLVVHKLKSNKLRAAAAFPATKAELEKVLK